MHRYEPDLVLRREITADEAFGRAYAALQAIGRVSELDKEQRLLRGEIAEQAVMKGPSLIEIKVDECGAVADVRVDVAGLGKQAYFNGKALKLFEEAFDRVDTPSYVPDRLRGPLLPLNVLVFLLAPPALLMLLWLLERAGALGASGH